MQYKVYGNLKREMSRQDVSYDDLRNLFTRIKNGKPEKVGKRWIQMRMNGKPEWDLGQCAVIMNYLGFDPEDDEAFLYPFRDGPNPNKEDVRRYDPFQTDFSYEDESAKGSLESLLRQIAREEAEKVFKKGSTVFN